MKNFFIAIAFSALSLVGMAEIANPEPLKVKQSDGTMLTIQLHGDEFSSHTTTIDGYTVVRCDDRTYRYAKIENGELVATNLIAHDASDRSEEEIRYCQQTGTHLVAPEPSEARAKKVNKVDEVRRDDLEGTMDISNFRGLVILVNYRDRKFLNENTLELFNDMINKEGYNGYQDPKQGWQTYTGSVRDYFTDSSMGTFTPEFDVVGPVEIDYSQYFAKSTSYGRTLARAALEAADPLVDFTKYDGDGDGRVDMVYIIYAGYSASTVGNDERLIWPHASTLSSYSTKYDGMLMNRYACSTELYGLDDATNPSTILAGIGTMCHEFSHVLGLHDHYDTQHGGTPVPGSWDLMSSGNHNNKGRTPVAYNMYERMVLGMGQPELIDVIGDYSLPELTKSNKAYKIKSGVKTEYFILENRQQVKWDASMAAKGLLVWRVDSSNVAYWQANKVNTMPDHPLFELVRAAPAYSSDGTTLSSYAGDPFPGSHNVANITNGSRPSLRSWNGTPCEFNIYKIQNVNGEMTFRVRDYEIPVMPEEFTSVTPFELSDHIEVQGDVHKWTLDNAKIAKATGYTSINGNAVYLYKGSSITSPAIRMGIDGVSFNVANTYTANSSLRVLYSTDNGETWTKVGDSKVFGAKRQGSMSFTNLGLPSYSRIKIECYSGSTTSAVYVDNIVITEDSPLTGISSIPALRNSNKGKTIYRFGNNVIKALNGHKYVTKEAE